MKILPAFQHTCRYARLESGDNMPRKSAANKNDKIQNCGEILIFLSMNKSKASKKQKL
jgi:hypothetical protein